ncbi:MAG TPA: FAD-binding oxidoreductase [Ferruginibacter sp.]|nr:FAD-binding oxidoreductase [Ferruginibacter sp.]
MQVSIWEKESFYRPADIIIIGSGFAGLWTALELKKQKPRLDVLLVDRGTIPTGASTRNAGFSCFGSLTELLYDANTFGEEKMLELATLRYAGLQHIQKTFKAKSIDYEQSSGYELLIENGNDDIHSLKQDIKRLNKILRQTFDEADIFRVADKKITKFGFSGIAHLVENKLEGSLHSGKLTQALLEQVQQQGVRTLFGFDVDAFEKTDDEVIVRNAQGVELTSKKLIICTNAFTQKLVPNLPVKPARGQVLVTSRIPDLPFKGCFHLDEGFLYFRNLGKRILLGGARNKFFDEEATTDLTTTNNIQQELEKLLQTVILPGRTDYTIEHRWSGIMGMGEDKMPTVLELQPGVYCAVAMGGIGVAMAPVVARQVTELALKKRKISVAH